MSAYLIQCSACRWATNANLNQAHEAIARHEQEAHANLTPEKILSNLLRAIDNAPRTPDSRMRFIEIVDDAAVRAHRELQLLVGGVENWADRYGYTIDKGVGDD